VGHSFGGYNVRVFNGLYPSEVSGLVLVDAPQEDQFRLLPPSWAAAADALLHRYRAQARWARLYIGLGIARVQLHLQHADAATFLILEPAYLQARASEMESMPVSAAQARAASGIAEKPLIVLTAGRSLDPASPAGLGQRRAAAPRPPVCARPPDRRSRQHPRHARRPPRGHRRGHPPDSVTLTSVMKMPPRGAATVRERWLEQLAKQ
jgi:pimeloyl-ACP methyl ester carboxylesterase